MSGTQLKEILSKTGLSLTEISDKLQTSTQNLNSMFKASDVRTGLIERLCAVLDMDITDFIKSDRIAKIEHSVSHLGNNNKNINNTTDASLLRIMERQSEQITTAQQQISDLIEILKKQ